MIAIVRLALGLSVAALVTGVLVADAVAASDGRALPLDDRLRGDGYVVTKSADQLSVGKKGFINVVVTARQGFKVNDQYPHKIRFKDIPDGLTVPAVLEKKDGAFEGKTRFRFKVPVTASKAGGYELGGKLNFSVCNDKSCIIQKKSISISLSAR